MLRLVKGDLRQTWILLSVTCVWFHKGKENEEQIGTGSACA